MLIPEGSVICDFYDEIGPIFAQGKMLGAGKSGFMLVVLNPEKVQNLIKFW